METPRKTGTVYLQPSKEGKKWKPVCLSVFPRSNRGGGGQGRLEIQTLGGGEHGNRRNHQAVMEKKVLQLTELINVLRLPPNAEACPMDNMCAFCVQTEERTLVFAALKDDCVEWVELLKQKQEGSKSGVMEENQIYVSTEEIPGFWVDVQRTEAAVRCDLQGVYFLEVGRESLLLRETQKKSVVRAWPYQLLRRYGTDTLALTIEAGRRCDSGPGSFVFQTPQAEDIFSLIQNSIKRLASPSTLGSAEGEAPPINLQECGSFSAPPAPITLMPLPSVPTQEKVSIDQAASRSDVIYDDPMECLQSEMKPQTAATLYVDPASILPLKPPGGVVTRPALKEEESEYSEVFDRRKPLFTDEPIYAEPMSSREKEVKKKVDPFAHLYAQVCKSTGSAPNVEHPTTATPYDASADDVIYENLGII